jgi:hypothetical protein
VRPFLRLLLPDGFLHSRLRMALRILLRYEFARDGAAIHFDCYVFRHVIFLLIVISPASRTTGAEVLSGYSCHRGGGMAFLLFWIWGRASPPTTFPLTKFLT